MVFSISNFRGKQLCGKQLKTYYQRKPVFTIGNLLKRLKYLVFITNSSTFVKSVERLNKLMLSKMKQYTTPEQTAKLIELGFEKPKGWYIDGVTNNIKLYVNIDENPMMFNYSIGELIEMLGVHLSSIYYIGIEWFVNAEGIECRRAELIDALYYMCIKLREEGVI